MNLPARWLSASAVDALARLALQTISTLIIARFLLPEAFGIAALVTVVVGVAVAIVGAPLEETLAQRQGLSIGHVKVVSFCTIAASTLAAVLLILGAPYFASLTGRGEMEQLLPIAAIFLLGVGPTSISIAIARRHRQFVALAISQSVCHLVATAAAIHLALHGAGMLGLVLQRLLPYALIPIVLPLLSAQVRRYALVTPAWSRKRMRELMRFSSIVSVDAIVDMTIRAVFVFAVNALYGAGVLGYLNMAMRVVEPLRGLVGAIGHNVAFAFFIRHRDQPAALGASVGRTVCFASLATSPIFLGLAACIPTLLPAILGPEWAGATGLIIVIAVAAAISAPLGFMYSALSALGRPEYGFHASTANLLILVALFLLGGQLPALAFVAAASVGLEVCYAAYGFVVVRRLLSLDAWNLFLAFAQPFLLACAMGVVVAGVHWVLAGAAHAFVVLLAQVLVGAALYALLVFLVKGDALLELVGARTAVLKRP